MSVKEDNSATDDACHAHEGVPEARTPADDKVELSSEARQDQPQLTTAAAADAPPVGEWKYGMCVGRSEYDTCMEAHWCWECQLSRQYNYLHYGKREIHRNQCLALQFLGILTCAVYPLAIGMSVRRSLRERYLIPGNCCVDCLQVCFLGPCELQQSLLQMTVMGDFPGASCYQLEDTTSVPSAEMV